MGGHILGLGCAIRRLDQQASRGLHSVPVVVLFQLELGRCRAQPGHHQGTVTGGSRQIDEIRNLLLAV